MPIGVYDHKSRSKETKQKMRISATDRWKDSLIYEKHIVGLKKYYKENPGKHKREANTFEAVANSSAATTKYFQENPGVRDGVNNPNWRGGIANLPYHPNFKLSLLTYIRQRDKVCQLCGRTREEEGRNLCVHHINHDKMNDCSDEYDFIVLCIGCNGRVRNNKDLWRDYFIYKITHGIMLVS